MIQKQEKKFIKNAIFISYTSLKDFNKCPRAYFLKNIYRNPKTGFRLQIASPHLTLGSTVHDAIKWYLQMSGQITKEQLIAKYRNFWLRFRGKKGGFADLEEEAEFGKRGMKMLNNFWENAKILEIEVLTIDFPKYNLIEDVVLTGNFDFVGLRDDGSLHLLDFKTGSKDEDDALQLDLYAILAESNFGKSVTKASYWYLDREPKPKEIVLDNLEEKLEWIIQKGLEVKKAISEGLPAGRQGMWVCSLGEDLCSDCRIYQAIIDGKGEFQFSDEKFKKDIYYLK